MEEEHGCAQRHCEELRERATRMAVEARRLAHHPLAGLSQQVWDSWQLAARQADGSQAGRPGFRRVGAASRLGSALLGSVGPLTVPFFLAYGLTRVAYIGTEACSALIMHLTKLAAYGTGDLLTREVLLYGLVQARRLSSALGPESVSSGR